MVYLRKLLFFLKYSTINSILNFMWIMFNEKAFNENFSVWEIYNNNKTKYGNTIIPCV